MGGVRGMNKHEWDPTDTECHAMQCLKCGLEIFFEDAKDWNRNLDGECKGEVNDPNRMA